MGKMQFTKPEIPIKHAFFFGVQNTFSAWKVVRHFQLQCLLFINFVDLFFKKKFCMEFDHFTMNSSFTGLCLRVSI